MSQTREGKETCNTLGDDPQMEKLVKLNELWSLVNRNKTGETMLTTYLCNFSVCLKLF